MTQLIKIEDKMQGIRSGSGYSREVVPRQSRRKEYRALTTCFFTCRRVCVGKFWF